VLENSCSFDGLDITVAQEPDAADLNAIKAGLVAFNVRAVGAAREGLCPKGAAVVPSVIP
jgi:stage V sporulation protein SpoVS